MNYTRKSFTVGVPISKEYAERWERTFRGELPRHRRSDGEFCAYLAHDFCNKCGWTPNACARCGKPIEFELLAVGSEQCGSCRLLPAPPMT